MSASDTTLRPAASPWLRSQRFDLVLIVGVWALAITTAAVVIAQPALLWPVIFANLWLLGYHHVVATYTRLCFDKESFSQSKFLIFALFPIVAAVTILVALGVGLWAVFTVYFHWQWYHYARQSWGLSRAYRSKDRNALYEDGWLDQAIFYAVPVLGLMHRSTQNPDTFLGSEIIFLPVPAVATTIMGAIAAALVAYWVYRRVVAWRTGRLATAHTLYLLSHISMFAVAYLVIEDITIGWLAVNIWHNAQYILFVWLYNSNRFKNGVDPEKRFLSMISQPNQMLLYFVVCLSITSIYYALVLGSLERLFYFGAVTSVVIYQTVNFHHYIVDSVIWKVRKPAVRKHMGISG